jgi:hypothetical protein
LNYLRSKLAHGWTVFEPVARTASYQQHVSGTGMPIDNEIMVGAVFVLADP